MTRLGLFLLLVAASSAHGGEADVKRRMYAKINVLYYVIFDPLNQLKQDLDGTVKIASIYSVGLSEMARSYSTIAASCCL